MNTEATANNNLLKHESSPYLLQHADNPVHWMAWNKQSLALAKQSNKPILLSIGYSACHWCHVMAHESFEDNKTADVMNDLFINIKVDKEERPDLDKIYQNAHSLLTERPGGWPLTVFLTPDTNMPIFAGTYFPREAKHGLPAFTSLLKQIADIWQSRKSDIQQQSNSLQSTYQRIYDSSKPDNVDFNHAVIDIARNQIEQQFDYKNGGFSGAPKFPHPAILEFALKHWCYTKRSNQADPRILHSAIFSLEKMADGGLFDHLGGGFFRYSTDELWMIPHFEKMLYDNGPLLSLYSQSWKINSDKLFHSAATETADWVIREMQSPDGGYYSAQDADSEGSEGKFFVWSQDEINELLDASSKSRDINTQSIEIFKERFGLNKSGNFEGLWHLHGYKPEAKLAEIHQQNEDDLHHQLFQIRQYLFKHRENRIHPDTDTKILCAWNGLMIHGMSITGRLLNKTEYTKSATRAAYFLKKHCWKDDRLFASSKDGKATLNAYADDYAFLIYGLLELLQNKWDNELYDWTLTLADKLLSDFEDTEYGGFFFTSHNHEDLIQRLKTFSDDAIPSGNAIAALALNRLGYLSGNPRYIESAKNCLKSAWSSTNNAPISHCALLTALGEYLSPPNVLIMRTVADDEKTWQSITHQYYLPFTLVYNIPADQTPHATLSEKVTGSASQAYPCSGTQCHKPIKTEAELHTYLRNNSYRVLE
ncbi:MAG: thioredoxin domain-containing protein [Gammaproteobacteria bacterium]|nr:thioredoxin domain-containing protein [Gammaproteobacteria bacterium]